MPRRTDIETILLIGSGPIVIGQGCEFDYAGTQACNALREEGYRVVLVNSNPATIMTDPAMADRTYVEPLTVEVLEAIIARERPNALLSTMGGQTALNLALALHDNGTLEKNQVALIGANIQAIRKAEDRQAFKEAMQQINLQVPTSVTISSLAEADAAMKLVGLPAIIRPAFTLGGSGGGVAATEAEYTRMVSFGLEQSPVAQVLIEKSVLGWKEFELELMRDRADNTIVVCSIENLDPMGIHTGDSITVAPAQTLTDKEYQRMRDAAIAIMREIGVDTGGANVQFAVNPADGDMVVVEMNPRVSRSSALASKATGYPIARIAAKLSVGYTLDELSNDIAPGTKAAFEPVVDYVVTKIPRFAFEKFPQTGKQLTTQMRSVGEVMSIGCTFPESFNKALRSLESGQRGLDEEAPPGDSEEVLAHIEKLVASANPDRVWWIADGFRRGIGIEEMQEATGIDPWFLGQIIRIIEMEQHLRISGLQQEELLQAKRLGFSDIRLANICRTSEVAIAEQREAWNIHPSYHMVDTCAAEFAARTPYLYSSYDSAGTNSLIDEAPPNDCRKVVILGAGPNRIGQGIEFDYCCVQAVLALREAGIESIMINCNPETVSTDYNIADRLYFEPLTFEDVAAILKRESPDGVVVQLGGQTPLALARRLSDAGFNILGTSTNAIDRAEDRGRCKAMIDKLGLRQPPSGITLSQDEAYVIAERIGYPVLIRPSYVLGGRAMQVVYDQRGLRDYLKDEVKTAPDHPLLIDSFLSDAIEVDVDALSDGQQVMVVGIMQHVEEAGIHSGDSCCSLPPYSLSAKIQARLRQQTEALALELGVVGLINVQFAIRNEDIFVLEVNPRASRTVPFVAKAMGISVCRIAMHLMLGERLRDLLGSISAPKLYAVKAPVFPFIKFPGVDPLLGPEMKSTGEVMGLDVTFAGAFARAQMASGNRLPNSGRVFVSVRDEDKEGIVHIVKDLIARGFELAATAGTAQVLREYGFTVETVNKVAEGTPHVVDRLRAGAYQLVINTTSGDAKIIRDSYSIRRTTIELGIPYFTTLAAARAAVGAMNNELVNMAQVNSLQEWHSPQTSR